jgi:ribosomal protein L7/L12
MIKDDFKYFKFLKSEGYSSESAYAEAKKLRLDYFTSIRMLRSIYGLSLTEAKKVTFQAEQYAYKDATPTRTYQNIFPG